MAGEGQGPLRRGLLAVSMLAVLLATLGAAWRLSALAQERVRAGADIIREIRSQGLGRFWPEPWGIDWFLIEDKTGPVGWRALVRGRTDSEFAGLMLDAGRQRYASEQWLLSDDAGSGLYGAREGIPGRPPRRLFDTEISLQDNTVTVVQNLEHGLTARSLEPPNYLPEGTLELAVRLVAQRRADAQFKMVFNERPNLGGAVRFGSVRLRYLSETRDQQQQPVSRVRMSTPERNYRLVYQVDQAGRLLAVSNEQTRWVRTEQDRILKTFPQAVEILRDLLPDPLRQYLETQDYQPDTRWRLRPRSSSARRISSPSPGWTSSVRV